MSTEIQENIINTAHKLVENNLVARTWGNLSQRIDENSFYCTPSGRDYADLTADEMVVCHLDGSYQGNLKPTTERSLHALIYGERADANFVIHTHQPYASALSISTTDYAIPEDLQKKLGSATLPTAAYGLPGQKKLHNAVMDALRSTGSRAVLMRSHGLIVFAQTAEEALQLALDVEDFCREEYERRTDIHSADLPPAAYQRGDGGRLPKEVERIFAKRPDIKCVLEDADPVVLQYKNSLPPYLDDFAQIVGIKMSANPYANAMFGENAVYYYGKDIADAEAVRMITHKNTLTATMANIFAVRPLPLPDRLIMNAVYRLTYSKRKEK